MRPIEELVEELEDSCSEPQMETLLHYVRTKNAWRALGLIRRATCCSKDEARAILDEIARQEDIVQIELAKLQPQEVVSCAVRAAEYLVRIGGSVFLSGAYGGGDHGVFFLGKHRKYATTDVDEIYEIRLVQRNGE